MATWTPTITLAMIGDLLERDHRTSLLTTNTMISSSSLRHAAVPTQVTNKTCLQCSYQFNRGYWKHCNRCGIVFDNNNVQIIIFSEEIDKGPPAHIGHAPSAPVVVPPPVSFATPRVVPPRNLLLTSLPVGHLVAPLILGKQAMVILGNVHSPSSFHRHNDRLTPVTSHLPRASLR